MYMYVYKSVLVLCIKLTNHTYIQETWKSRNLPNATSSPQSLIIICDL